MVRQEEAEGERDTLKTKILPDSFLRCMAKDERKSIGQKTSAECQEIVLAKREKEIHRNIENWLRQREIFYVHSRTDKRTTNAKGVPDFIFAWRLEGPGEPAKPTAVEVKVGPNILTNEQIAVRDQMQGNGWRYHVVSSLPELMAYLQVAPAP